ncbi:hypothetical protein GHT06_018394 [Daphnia sinensis]|uniref:Uncharacterized protein n=1 Tax=Daphnia sinensis TaxID=1820382 RepID=A0AAD5KNS6_9CRUS|nr:hypothetical protein GHT06_018394 [Daphnia sinensis]
MADDEEETRQAELQALFMARTTAKRRHTNFARKINTIIKNGASRAELNDLLASLNQAYASLVDVHERFVTVSWLDGEDLHTAQVYLESVQILHTACLGHVERAQRVGAAGEWNVSVNVNATSHTAPEIRYLTTTMIYLTTTMSNKTRQSPPIETLHLPLKTTVK